MLLQAFRTLPGAPKRSRRSQALPGAPKRSQELPGVPGALKRSQRSQALPCAPIRCTYNEGRYDLYGRVVCGWDWQPPQVGS
eukprot:4445754-Pyramimonas_sp.AAC.1